MPRRSGWCSVVDFDQLLIKARLARAVEILNELVNGTKNKDVNGCVVAVDKAEAFLKTIGGINFQPVPCETCGEDLAGLDLEYHYGRNHHPKEPSRDEFKLSLRDSNLRIGKLKEAARG